MYPEVSERTRQRVDDEMRKVVAEAHDAAVDLLSQNRERLDSLAEALYRAETLEGPEAYAAAGLKPPSEESTEVEPASNGAVPAAR
jgi:cell division protease FtsH